MNVRSLIKWCIAVLYLGAGIIIGATLTLGDWDYNVPFAVGGICALVGAGIYGFCMWRVIKHRDEILGESPDRTLE